MISATQGANLNIFKLISGTRRKAPPLSLPIPLYFHPERWRLAVLRCYIGHLSATTKEFPRSFPTPYTPLLRLSPYSLPLLQASSSISRSSRFINRSPTTSSLPPFSSQSLRPLVLFLFIHSFIHSFNIPHYESS